MFSFGKDVETHEIQVFPITLEFSEIDSITLW